jgi:flagellar biosynthetic protein FlhB
MSAPTVIAKGANHIAFKIREIARQHGVTIMEDKPLAQALYATVEVNDQIPESLYKAVAEILAHVYRQKGDPRIGRSSDRGDQPSGGSGFGMPAMGSAPWKRLRYGGLSKDR